MLKKIFIFLSFILITNTFAQSYKLGFNTELSLFPSSGYKGNGFNYLILPLTLKMNFGYDNKSLINFDLRAGYGVDSFDNLRGWQVGAYYKPYLLEGEFYGIIGLNNYYNQKLYVGRSGESKDKRFTFLGLGIGGYVSEVMFVELLFYQTLGDKIIQYDSDYPDEGMKLDYYVKLNLGFAWDL